MHAQIVVCRGVNDGKALSRTDQRPGGKVSGGAVHSGRPGRDRRRTGETRRRSARWIRSTAAISSTRLRRWQKLFNYDLGTRLVWAADTVYLCADKDVPVATFYEGFPQLENGVGLLRQFKTGGRRAKSFLPESLPSPLTVSLVTGVAAAPVIEDWVHFLDCENLHIRVFPITNEFFGESVTVAGLITGKDLISQLKGKELGDVLVIPAVALRDGVFLDDVTVEEVASALGCRVEVVDRLPRRLLRRILEIAEE